MEEGSDTSDARAHTSLKLRYIDDAMTGPTHGADREDRFDVLR
jgi:hypothetical protein